MIRPPPTSFPNMGWRKTAEQVRGDDEFIERCLLLWDAGYDTRAISIKLMQPEYAVEAAVWIGRNKRRIAKESADNWHSHRPT